MNQKFFDGFDVLDSYVSCGFEFVCLISMSVIVVIKIQYSSCLFCSNSF